jgi:endonuclease-3
MEKKSNPETVLNSIRNHIHGLNPPVEAFESSIRTGPFRILISVLLSSRTKDPVTLKASRALFAAADTPEEMLKLGSEKISKMIFPVGFYSRKSDNIMKICRILIDRGGVPDTFDELVRLPGVGRKTANLVLALAFDIPAIAVDTHVYRISRRLGWTGGNSPETVEEELKELFPVRLWNRLNKTLVGFGQTVCAPRNPDCDKCPVSRYCRFFRSKT